MRRWEIISSLYLFIAALLPIQFTVANDAWLESGLPPLIEPGKEPPFEITQVAIKRNDVDQELLTGEYRRKRVIPTLASEVWLVILTANGGRFGSYIDPQITQSPFPS